MKGAATARATTSSKKLGHFGNMIPRWEVYRNMGGRGPVTATRLTVITCPQFLALLGPEPEPQVYLYVLLGEGWAAVICERARTIQPALSFPSCSFPEWVAVGTRLTYFL